MTRQFLSSALIAFYLLLPSLPVQAQDIEWIRTARSGYEVYAPVTLANGIYGITLSEQPFAGNPLQLAGIYDYFPEKGNDNAIRGIDFSRMELIVMPPEAAGSERADFLKGKRLSRTRLDELENWQQTFNFREGWFQTDFHFEGLRVEHTVYVLNNMARTGIIELSFTAQEDLHFSLKNILSVDHPYQMESADYLQQLRDRRVPLFTATAHSPSGKYRIATTSSFHFKGDAPPLQFEDEDSDQPALGFEQCLKKGQSFTCYLIGSVGSSYHFTDPAAETARLNIYTFLKGPEKVIAEHKRQWVDFWDKTDIVIEGAPEATKDIRQMMFFVNSFVRPGTAFSSACMGFGRDAWGHRVLWDADFWIYPALLLINPEAARSMLEYRWQRLEMAKNNAANHGYAGAMFPWESGASGEEQTPLIYLTGPFQHHITADVGLAFWRYYCVMQDKDFLRKRAYPVLREVADFWVSRSEQTAPGQYEILNVVSADEHAVNVDNDAFTNAAAKSVLKAGAKAAEILGESPPPAWLEVAEGLVIRHFEDGTVREHDTYEGETIKQAATNMGAFPLEVIRDSATILKNLNYYEARVDEDGPNMTWPMYTGAAARAGNAEKALYFFEKSTRAYKKGPFAILALRPYLNTTFFGTSSGGILQSVILGFGGLHFTAEGLIQQNPVLPEGWRSITLKGIGKGQDFEVGRGGQGRWGQDGQD